METANATRPKRVQPWNVRAWRVTTEWPDEGPGGYPRILAGNRTIAHAVDKCPETIASFERAVACVQAMDGIRNPAAIPALIDAALALYSHATPHRVDQSDRVIRAATWSRFVSALAALDAPSEDNAARAEWDAAEPVA